MLIIGSADEKVSIDPDIFKDTVADFLPVLATLQEIAATSLDRAETEIENTPQVILTDRFSRWGNPEEVVKMTFVKAVSERAQSIFGPLGNAADPVSDINTLNGNIIDEVLKTQQPRDFVSKMLDLVGKDYVDVCARTPQEKAEQRRVCTQYIKDICTVLTEGAPTTMGKASRMGASVRHLAIAEEALDAFRKDLLSKVERACLPPAPAADRGGFQPKGL